MTPAAAIHPVILLCGPSPPGLAGPERVARQRTLAREALARSARYAGTVLPALEKDADGAPIPADGWYWSLSHKPEVAAAVIAPVPVGIDVETVRTVVEGLHRKIAEDAEWEMAGGVAPDTLFRFWTAKEAVLKRAGTGLRELSHCRIAAIDGDTHMRLEHRGQVVTVRHLCSGKHIVAITDTGSAIRWHIETPRT